MNNKKNLLDQVGGLDVELTTTKMEADSWASNMIKEVGKTIGPNEKKYMGSVVTHFYVDNDSILKNKYEMASIAQIMVDDMSEQLVLLGINNTVIELRKHFGHKHSTRRPGDKR